MLIPAYRCKDFEAVCSNRSVDEKKTITFPYLSLAQISFLILLISLVVGNTLREFLSVKICID